MPTSTTSIRVASETSSDLAETAGEIDHRKHPPAQADHSWMRPRAAAVTRGGV